MYLFFDTETTGVPQKWDAPLSDAARWPRVVQLAWMLFDEMGNELSANSYLVRPEGFHIPKSATRIHHITTAAARANGISLREATRLFLADVEKATYLVGHNIAFDERVVGAELYRLGLTNVLPFKERLCTMQQSVAFCKIPAQHHWGYKYPLLRELYYTLFHQPLQHEHNAEVDARATASCFWELRRLQII